MGTGVNDVLGSLSESLRNIVDNRDAGFNHAVSTINVIKQKTDYGRQAAESLLKSYRISHEAQKISAKESDKIVRRAIGMLYSDNPGLIDEAKLLTTGRGYLSRLEEEFK